MSEPVATVRLGGALNDEAGYWVSSEDYVALNKLKAGTKIYTQPPQREWAGLTLDEILQILKQDLYANYDKFVFARAVEAALKEKNHG